MPDRAFLTLVTNDVYLPGVLALHKSLVDAGSKYPLVVMATPSLPQEVRDVITRRGITIRDIEPLKPREGLHHLSDHDIRFSETWTKLREFELTEYKRVVVLDSDMIIRRNIDDLMDMELPDNWIAAVHVCACNPNRYSHYPADWVRENCPFTAAEENEGKAPPAITGSSPRPYGLLNSGVVVLQPSATVFSDIYDFLTTSEEVKNYTFPDQDLLAEYFKDRWKPLPWYYNGLKTLRVIHPRLWRDDEVRCVHYIFKIKPWSQRPEMEENPHYQVLSQWWWDVYEKLRLEMSATDPEGLVLVERLVKGAPA
ncbi:glycosyltransferase family 8 protein [Trametes sanguinea]|nr:glycosyltransferase family 8 protein [Trametes sanguinea]